MTGTAIPITHTERTLLHRARLDAYVSTLGPFANPDAERLCRELTNIIDRYDAAWLAEATRKVALRSKVLRLVRSYEKGDMADKRARYGGPPYVEGFLDILGPRAPVVPQGEDRVTP